jgi:hypothetical protein
LLSLRLKFVPESGEEFVAVFNKMRIFYLHCKTVVMGERGGKIFIQSMSKRIFPQQQERESKKIYANNLREKQREKKNESFSLYCMRENLIGLVLCSIS